MSEIVNSPVEGIRFEQNTIGLTNGTDINKELEHILDNFERNELEREIEIALPSTRKLKWKKLRRFGHYGQYKRYLIRHLKTIAKLQWKIIATLKRVEQNSRESKNCGLHHLAQQRAAMEDLKASILPHKSAR